MNMISSSTAPYLLYSELSGKPKQTYGNRFSDALEKEKAENNITESAAEIAVNEMDKARKGSTEPSYTVTEEEAEYFREKYGEKYNEDTAYELYYELADKEIISINDAARSSGTSVAMPLSAFKSITYFGGGDPYGLGKNLNRDIGFVSDRVYIKDVSRTDKDSPYKVLWDSFKKSYDRKTDTWEDALQETIDFERYVKENKSTANHVFRQHREQVIEGLEKTKDVIMQIFGDKNL